MIGGAGQASVYSDQTFVSFIIELDSTNVTNLGLQKASLLFCQVRVNIADVSVIDGGAIG